MKHETFDLPVIGRAASVVPATVNETERTVEVCWTTGATVQRSRWVGWDGVEHYDEELSVDPEHLRLGRLNSGAPFLDSHSAWRLESVLGVVVDGSVRLDGGKGYATILFSEREAVDPIWRDIVAGIIRNVSVGYRVHEYQVTQREGERDHYLAVDWEPFEISAVAIGADPEAQMRSADRQPVLNACVLTRQNSNAAAAALPKGTDMSKPKKAADVTTDDVRSSTTATTLDVTTADTPATPTSETRSEGDQPSNAAPSADAVADGIAAERERCAAIRELCQRHGLDADFENDLIRKGTSIDEVRTQVLDKIADTAPFNGRSSETAPAAAKGADGQAQGRSAAMQSAILHRFRPDEYKLADGARDYRGLSLMEMAREALEQVGVGTRGMSKMELSGLVFSHRSAGMHSTSDFPAILANVANKTLRDAYDTTPRTFGAWARRSTITDFKPVSRAQLGGAPDLQKVMESGEFKYGTMGEGSEVYGLATYGRIIGITRQTLINDDLDAFTRVPTAFGAAAADLESDIVYSILIDNPNMADGTALFHSTRGNLGSASVINEGALAKAYRGFGNQKGLENRHISVIPRYIIVPPGDRSVEARKQVTATTPNSTADVNTFANRLEVVEEARLIPSSGQDPWFMAADPARIDTVEYAYLDGQDGVYTETRMGFEKDGMEIKARHDFAAKAIDAKGLYKNAGAAPA